MITTRKLVGGLVTVLFIGLNFTTHAQVRALAATELVAVETVAPDSVARLAADAKNLPAVSPNQLPRHATYWIVTGDGSFLMPMPFLPHDQANAPIFSLGSPGQFLVDGSGGVAPRPTRNQAARGITAAVLLERQGNAILDLLDQVHTADLKAQQTAESDTLEMSSGKMSKSGGSELSGLESFISYGTNLWLEIVTVTNKSASLVIHPPAGTSNEVYELLYSTNLLMPLTNWQWVLRSYPQETNLIVPNVIDSQGFYQLRQPDDYIANDSLGTNFWVVLYNAVGTVSFFISSPMGASGTLTIPKLGFTNTFSVSAGSTTNIDIPIYSSNDYDQVGDYGIQVVTSRPISVYALVLIPHASSAFTCYPTSLLGTNYCVMAYPGYYALSEFTVVATGDNTTVTITPVSPTNLRGHTSSYTEILQRGQTYQNFGTVTSADVTGTLITSDKPIGVFAGAGLASVNSSYGDGNPLVQEQLPVDQWGTHALAMPFYGGSSENNYRILAAYNNTVIVTNGVVAGTNQAGQFLDFNVDGPMEFQSNLPFQAAHLASSMGGGGTGGPSEILLPPIGHCLKTNIVVTPEFFDSFLNVIVAQSAITNTLLDGSNLDTTNFVPIGISGYYGAQLLLTNAGPHTVSSSQPISVEVYGFSYADAYGYFGGTVK